MNHGNKLKKLGKSSSHRRSMFANMSVSLILHEQITTTLPKAKAIRPILEKLVTLGRERNLNNFRKLLAILRNKMAVNKLFDNLSPRYNSRPGGYLRILKAGFRQGDNAPMAVVEFVDRDLEAKGKDYFSANAVKSVKEEKDNHAKEAEAETKPKAKAAKKKAAA